MKQECSWCNSKNLTLFTNLTLCHCIPAFFINKCHVYAVFTILRYCHTSPMHSKYWQSVAYLWSILHSKYCYFFMSDNGCVFISTPYCCSSVLCILLLSFSTTEVLFKFHFQDSNTRSSLFQTTIIVGWCGICWKSEICICVQFYFCYLIQL